MNIPRSASGLIVWVKFDKPVTDVCLNYLVGWVWHNFIFSVILACNL